MVKVCPNRLLPASSVFIQSGSQAGLGYLCEMWIFWIVLNGLLHKIQFFQSIDPLFVCLGQTPTDSGQWSSTVHCQSELQGTVEKRSLLAGCVAFDILRCWKDDHLLTSDILRRVNTKGKWQIQRGMFVCLFTSEVLFKRLFAPTSQSRMSKKFRDSESLGKSNGKKWSHIWKLLLIKGVKLQRIKAQLILNHSVNFAFLAFFFKDQEVISRIFFGIGATILIGPVALSPVTGFFLG